MKMFLLPTSRWSAIKDKIVNIPIPSDDVLQTVTSLPRTPTEAGIIPVKLKRKLAYKNVHNIEYISPSNIVNALKELKKHGHKYYMDIEDVDIVKKCRETDPTGLNLLGNLEDDDVDIDNIDETAEDQDGLKSDGKDESDQEEKEEIEYRTKDPVRKFQFDYDTSVGMSDNCPEVRVDTVPQQQTQDSDNTHAVAPGEGKIPSSLLQDTNWDVQAFPHLFKDGKNGLHDESRERTLQDQQFFSQRIFNLDRRFSTCNPYIFAAVGITEMRQLQRNINISFCRGKVSKNSNNENSYSLQDAFSVLDNLKNTPR